MILGDHPLYQVSRLERNANNLVILRVDDGHVKFLRERMSAKRIIRRVRTHFSHVEWSAAPDLKDRPYDLVFPASWGDYEGTRESLEHENPVLRKVLRNSVDQMIDEPGVAVQDAMDRSLWDVGIDPARVSFQKYCTFLLIVDRFVRLERRMRALCAIKKSRGTRHGKWLGELSSSTKQP